jgi:hypothetical protein
MAMPGRLPEVLQILCAFSLSFYSNASAVEHINGATSLFCNKDGAEGMYRVVGGCLFRVAGRGPYAVGEDGMILKNLRTQRCCETRCHARCAVELALLSDGTELNPRICVGFVRCFGVERLNGGAVLYASTYCLANFSNHSISAFPWCEIACNFLC